MLYLSFAFTLNALINLLIVALVSEIVGERGAMESSVSNQQSAQVAKQPQAFIFLWISPIEASNIAFYIQVIAKP